MQIKKVIGKFKDEAAGLIITDALALTSNTYSFNCQTKKEYDKVQINLLINDFLGYIPDKYSYESEHKIDTYETENTKKFRGVSRVIVTRRITS